ncbi:MAG: D-2-hydroxyacid dehydrogenase [Woeseiaceae bacterium]|nr:D-2-hydroxyacid dehydrogenase [Woeseiaceae bacterium]
MFAFARCFFVILVIALLPGVASAQSDLESLVAQTGVEPGDTATRDHPRWREPRKIVVRDIAGLYDGLAASDPGVELVRVRSEAEAIAAAPGADAILGYCSAGILDAATDAVWIQVFSAGVESCVVHDRIRSGDVVLTNMQKMSSPVIAEHVVAMMLSLSRALPAYAKKMESGQWLRGREHTGPMQSYGGKTVLIVGLGGIGTEVARRAAALDMRVVATRRSSREGPEFVDYVGLSGELPELAARADFIVNALPLTDETAGLFDAEFFAAAKDGAHFINVGRGKTVVTADLVAALESGQLAGAGLDVTDPEPLPSNHPLWQMDNVIITPHISSRGGNFIRHGLLAAENLRRFAAGEALFNVVDPDAGY